MDEASDDGTADEECLMVSKSCCSVAVECRVSGAIIARDKGTAIMAIWKIDLGRSNPDYRLTQPRLTAEMHKNFREYEDFSLESSPKP